MRRRSSFLLGLALAVTGLAASPAPTPDALAAAAKQDLEVALAELATLRTQIESERLPLARQVNDLEQQLIARRAAWQQQQREEGNQLVLLNLLKTEVNARSNEVRFLEAFLTEYRRAFETRLHVSERSRHEPRLAATRAATESVEAAPAERLAAHLGLLETALDRLEHSVGGATFEGQALSSDGRLERGRFVLVGPAAYFSSAESPAAGVVEERLNSAEPNVVAIPTEFTAGLRELATTSRGVLPLDPTLGNAVRLRATQDSLTEHIAKGGPVMVPILLLGVVAVGIFTAKWLQVGRVRVATPADLHLILASLIAGHREKAARHAQSMSGPVGEMLGMAVQHADERKEYIEEVMYEKMLSTRPRLERWVPFLALAAAAAPLLGLLGTVTGMINTFNMITVFGTGDPKTLAGGISEALITTEFGLVVAIPSLLLHAVISRKVKGVLGSMEQITVGFINGLPSPSPETPTLEKSC
jgi:biopolymer transport protein ExbB